MRKLLRSALCGAFLLVAAHAQITTPGGGGGSGTVSGLSANCVPKAATATTITGCSTMTDDGSTVTATIPYAVSGSTAGYTELQQGSTNGTGTTSARIQAPAAVTSYVVNVPAAAPTNNNSAMVFTNASPAVGSFAKMPQTAITSGAAYTNATTTFSNVVGGSGQTLQFSVEASTNYIVHCKLVWQGSANTTGPKFQWTGPASPTAVAATAFSNVTATTFNEVSSVAFSSSMANAGTITTATNFVADVTLGLVNGTNAGTVTLQAAANGAGTLTIQPGSFCQLQ
jgi:hypothetical protein